MITHQIVKAGDETGIKCLACGMVSYNYLDVKNVYCGNCHQYHPIALQGSSSDRCAKAVEDVDESVEDPKEKGILLRSILHSAFLREEKENIRTIRVLLSILKTHEQQLTSADRTAVNQMRERFNVKYPTESIHG